MLVAATFTTFTIFSISSVVGLCACLFAGHASRFEEQKYIYVCTETE